MHLMAGEQIQGFQHPCLYTSVGGLRKKEDNALINLQNFLLISKFYITLSPSGPQRPFSRNFSL